MQAVGIESRLPLPLSSFIGRQAELDSVRRLLDTGARLITLTGPGGVGKTRLALEVTSQVATDFAHGAFFLSVQALTDSEQVLPDLAAALGVHESGNRPFSEELAAALADKHALVCIDNWEQVLGAAPQLAELLSRCRRLHVLATSREALRLRGEQVFPLQPLSLPPSGEHALLAPIREAEAFQLFIARAQAVRPGFQADDAAARTIAEICTWLDGLPLAIELAAALLRLFSPQGLLTRLKNSPSLTGRSPTMELGAGGPRDLPDRQQTLRGAIEWSYNLLDRHEQRLFRRLAVFAGGCDLEAAEAVCGDEAAPCPMMESLLALVDKSLLRASDINGEPRFEMLRTIQEYALEQLEASGEQQAAHRLHADHYAALIDRAKQGWYGPEQVRWLERLEREHGNVRVVLGWALQHGQAEIAYRVGGFVWRLWMYRGHYDEGNQWLNRILAVGGAAPLLSKVRVLGGAASLAERRGDLLVAQRLWAESLLLSREIGDLKGMAASLIDLGRVEELLGDREAGLSHMQESLHLYRQVQDRSGEAESLHAMALALLERMELERARDLVLQSLAIHRELGLTIQIAECLTTLGEILLAQQSYEQSRQHFLESKALFSDYGDTWGVSVSDSNLGVIALHLGQLQQAESHLADGLRGAHLIGERLRVASGLEGLACVAAAGSSMERAARLWGAAQGLRRTIGAAPTESERLGYERYLRAARAQLREPVFNAAAAAGTAMSLDQAVRYALESYDVEDGSPRTKAARPAYPAGLTAREVEVLALVAEGLTDSEVAERLVLSPRTVNAHLTSIYNKLGVNTRAAATRFAVEQKLV